MFVLGIAVYNTIWTLTNTREKVEYEPIHNLHFDNTVLKNFDQKKLEEVIAEMKETKTKLERLEEKFQNLSARVQKPYPDIKYLNYHNKKRILVC